MRTAVPEEILKICDEIDASGSAPLTHLAALEKWFVQRPRRLPAFGLWIARRAAGRKGKTKGEAGALLDKTRALLGSSATRESMFQQIDRDAARKLHDRARDFQNQFRLEDGGQARIIECRPLLLVELGLALHVGLETRPVAGFELAAEWARSNDPRHGNMLSGPSRGKLDELVRFMFGVEALEDEED